MHALERIKSVLVGTPLERPARTLRWLWDLRRLRVHPELHAIHFEERILERLLSQLVQRDSNCVDVGCHLGAALSEFLHLAPDGQHAAFEPVPHKAAWLRQKFPAIDVHELALADKPGEVTFYVNPTHSGFSGLQARAADDPGFQAITVRQGTLDETLDQAGRIHLLKVDVEGGELAVLRGGVETLRRSQPYVLFECTRKGNEARGTSAEELYKWFVSIGYSVFLPAEFLAERSPLSLERFTAAQEYPFQAFNFLAVPPSPPAP